LINIYPFYEVAFKSFCNDNVNNIAFLAREYLGEHKRSFYLLCSYIRNITGNVAYQTKYGKKPSGEIQTLLDLLFKEKKNNGRRLFDFHADLKYDYWTSFKNTILEPYSLEEITRPGRSLELTKPEPVVLKTAFDKPVDWISSPVSFILLFNFINNN
jgi:hypothetical protein